MPSDAAIDDLRRQIDEIDTRLHDLLMRRSSVVAEIGTLKGSNGNGYFRPGREAAILRRLVERHQGSLPKATVKGPNSIPESSRMGESAPNVTRWPGRPERASGLLDKAVIDESIGGNWGLNR